MIVDLFRQFDADGVRYAQFKSTQRLDESFEGRTDFDLLVHPDDVDRACSIARRFGFLRRLTTNPLADPDIIDFIGYDRDQDTLHHLSVHARLVFGEVGLKNHCVPDSEAVLRRARRHPSLPIRVVAPDFELLLLCLRVALKTRVTRGWVKALIRRNGGAWVPERPMLRELDALTRQVDPGAVLAQAESLVPGCVPAIEALLEAHGAGALGPVMLLRLRARVRRGLRPQRIRSASRARAARLRASLRRAPTVRTPETGGRIVALVGADGAGKSTTSHELVDWLSYKLSAQRLYLGLRRSRGLPRLAASASVSLRRVGLAAVGRRAEELAFLLNARARVRLVQAASKARDQGWVVICDRYPLDEFRWMDEPMDGPRLPSGSRWSAREVAWYDSLASSPDAILALDVDLATAAARKHVPPSSRWRIEQKVEAIQRLRDGHRPDYRVVVVDARAPHDEVLARAKSAVWDVLREPRTAEVAS